MAAGALRLADIRSPKVGMSAKCSFCRSSSTSLPDRVALTQSAVAVSDGMFPVRKFLRPAVYGSAALIDSIKANSCPLGHKVDAHFF